MLAKELKSKLANGELNLGMIILYNCWPGYLEIMKRSGYDVAWLDCEHSAFTLQQVDQMCRVARLLELPLIIRAETTSYHLIRRYIDAGPSGIIIPEVLANDHDKHSRKLNLVIPYSTSNYRT